jgi:hypothetical protein
MIFYAMLDPPNACRRRLAASSSGGDIQPRGRPLAA